MTSRRNERQLVVALTQQDRGYKAGLEAGARQARKFGREVDQVSQGGIKRMNSSLDVSVSRIKTFVGVLGAAAVGRELAQWATSVKDSAVSLNESINAINVVAGEGADQILAFGENAASSVGLAQSAFNQSVVPIVANLRNMGFSADEAGDAAIRLAERAADTASVFNTEVNEPLEAFQAALRGEGDPAERFGASISAARVEALLLNEGLVESKSAITDADKVMGRYLLLLEDTASVQGDFANTSDELANKTRIFEARLEDWRAEVGQAVIPIFEELLDVGEDLIPTLETLGSSVVPALADAFINFVEGVRAIVEGFSGLPDAVKGTTLALGGLSAGLALIYAHPVVAGLGLVTAGVAAIGATARAEKERVEALTEAINTLNETGDKGAVLGEIGSQIIEAVGSADTLLAVLDDIGVSLSTAKRFAIGDPAAVDVVTSAFQNYRAAANAAFESGDISAQDLAGLIGTTSDSALVESKLGDVADRYHDVAGGIADAAGEEAKLQRVEDIEEYNRLVSRQHAIITDTVQTRVDAARVEAAAAATIKDRYDELEKQLNDIADTYAGRLSSAASSYLDIFTEAPDLETVSADQLLSNLEERANRVAAFQEGIARLQREDLFPLAQQFIDEGVGSVDTLSALIADLDEGGATAFTLNDTIEASQTEIQTWAEQMGMDFALATGPLLDQGRTFGEQWAEAVAAGISDTQLQLLVDAQIISQGTPSSLPRGLDQGIEFRANGGPVVAGGAYVINEGRPEVFVPEQSGSMVPISTGTSVTNHFTFAPVISSTAAAADLSDELVRKFSDEITRFDAGARRPR